MLRPYPYADNRPTSLSDPTGEVEWAGDLAGEKNLESIKLDISDLMMAKANAMKGQTLSLPADMDLMLSDPDPFKTPWDDRFARTEVYAGLVEILPVWVTSQTEQQLGVFAEAVGGTHIQVAGSTLVELIAKDKEVATVGLASILFHEMVHILQQLGKEPYVLTEGTYDESEVVRRGFEVTKRSDKELKDVTFEMLDAGVRQDISRAIPGSRRGEPFAYYAQFVAFKDEHLKYEDRLRKTFKGFAFETGEIYGVDWKNPTFDWSKARWRPPFSTRLPQENQSQYPRTPRAPDGGLLSKTKF